MSFFAKLFNVRGPRSYDQLLVVVDFAYGDNEQPSLVITTDSDGTRVSMAIGFKTEATAQRAFDQFDEERAQQFYETLTAQASE